MLRPPGGRVQKLQHCNRWQLWPALCGRIELYPLPLRICGMHFVTFSAALISWNCAQMIIGRSACFQRTCCPKSNATMPSEAASSFTWALPRNSSFEDDTTGTTVQQRFSVLEADLFVARLMHQMCVADFALCKMFLRCPLSAEGWPPMLTSFGMHFHTSTSLSVAAYVTLWLLVPFNQLQGPRSAVQQRGIRFCPDGLDFVQLLQNQARF